MTLYINDIIHHCSTETYICPFVLTENSSSVFVNLSYFVTTYLKTVVKIQCWRTTLITFWILWDIWSKGSFTFTFKPRSEEKIRELYHFAKIPPAVFLWLWIFMFTFCSCRELRLCNYFEDAVPGFTSNELLLWSYWTALFLKLLNGKLNRLYFFLYRVFKQPAALQWHASSFIIRHPTSCYGIIVIRAISHISGLWSNDYSHLFPLL